MKKLHKKKVRMISLHLFELDQLRIYLEDMAAKGWMLSNLGTGFMIFSACEPQEVTFYIDIYTQGSYMNPFYIDEKEVNYIEFILDYGYELITKKSNFQVFVSHRKQPVPIHSEESEDMMKERASTILKFEWLNYIFGTLLMGIFFIFFLWMHTTNFYFYTNPLPYTMLFMFMLFIYRGIPSIRWLIQKEKYHKTYRQILHRDQIFEVFWALAFVLAIHDVLQLTQFRPFLFLFVSLLCIIGIFFLLDHILASLHQKYHGAFSILVIILLLFYGNHFILNAIFDESTQEHTKEVENYSEESSFFITTRKYNQSFIEDEQIPYRYTIYTIKIPFMTDYLLNKYLEPFKRLVVVYEDADYIWMQDGYRTLLVVNQSFIELEHTDYTKEEILDILAYVETK